MSGSHLSRDFFDLVKAIGESKPKQVRLVIRTPPLSLLRHCSLSLSRAAHGGKRLPYPQPKRPAVARTEALDLRRRAV